MLLRHADFYGILEDAVCLRCFQTCQAVVLNWAEPKSKKGTDYMADPSSHVSAGECAVAGPSGPGVSITLSWGHFPARSESQLLLSFSSRSVVHLRRTEKKRAARSLQREDKSVVLQNEQLQPVLHQQPQPVHVKQKFRPKKCAACCKEPQPGVPVQP